MDLKEFVSETLLAIISGVDDAQKKAKTLGAHVNPGGLMRNIKNVETTQCGITLQITMLSK